MLVSCFCGAAVDEQVQAAQHPAVNDSPVLRARVGPAVEGLRVVDDQAEDSLLVWKIVSVAGSSRSSSEVSVMWWIALRLDQREFQGSSVG